MLKLGDVVSLDTKGEFRSDVQLSDYDKPELNLGLLQSYIFSTTAPALFGSATNAIAAGDLLHQLTLGFTYAHGRVENRMVAIANYGHGKSHLALVLANYFAKPTASPEIRMILDRIEQAYNNPAKARHYHDFKQERGEFLVVRLRGDTPRTLREQFFRELKQALSEHEQTGYLELPFWSSAAARYLRNLSENTLSLANKYLAKHQMDVALLLEEVQDQREDAYGIYVELFSHLNHGVRPSTEGNVSLSEAVAWAIQNCCGEGKLSGLLILFDEFSQFVQRYAYGKAVGELQDLLQGIEDHRGKAVFLAFAQHDPKEVAEQSLKGGQGLQSLQKELERLPRKYALYSLMESVLDSYLTQNPDAWNQLLRDKRIKGLLYGQSSNLTWETFTKRYEDELRWDFIKFREVVTEGCFPLHPMTTALLGHLRMEQGEAIGGARTVLGFVSDQLEQRVDQPAIVDGVPNWVLPIALVDYFQRHLVISHQIHAAYEEAERRIELVFQGQDTQAHRAILKALLLYEAARFTGTGDKQVELLSQLCGCDVQSTSRILQKLSEQNVIRHDSIQSTYSFYPFGSNPYKLDKRIQQVAAKVPFDIDDLNQSLMGESSFHFGRVPVDIAWGHQEDWAADERIITRDQLTSEGLRKLFTPFSFGSKGFEDGQRGLVLWIMMQEDFDRNDLRDQAKLAVDEAWPTEAPPPVIVVIPNQPVPELREHFLRKVAIKKLDQDKDVKQEFGRDIFTRETARCMGAVVSAMRRLRGDENHVWTLPRESGEIIVPTAYRISVSQARPSNLRRVLETLYEVTYRHRPDSFFKQYAVAQARGTSKLRTAIKTVAKNLLFDRIGSTLGGMDNVAKDLCKEFLAARWEMLTPERGGAELSLALQKPASRGILSAWEQLDLVFKSGTSQVPLDETISRLLNPPYGFDYGTILIILSGWIGYHRHEAELSAKGRLIPVRDLEEWIEKAKTPKDFLILICKEQYLTITLRDPSEDQQKAQTFIQRIHNGDRFSQEEAAQAIEFLREYAENDKLPTDEHQQATNATEVLDKSLTVALGYDSEVLEIIERADRERSIDSLITLRNRLLKLPVSRLVTVRAAAPDDIAENLAQKFEEAFDLELDQINALSDITQVGTIRNKVLRYRKQMQDAGLVGLVEQCAALEKSLEKRRKYLDTQASESSLHQVIDAMTPSADLTQLHLYEERLQQIDGTSSDLSRKRDRKFAAITAEIQQLEDFAANIGNTVYTIDLKEIRKRRDEISARYSRYGDSDKRSVLDQAREYLDTLGEFANQLRDVRVRDLQTENDVERARDYLNKIYQEFCERLSRHHIQLLSQFNDDIDGRVQQLEQAAIQQFEILESEVQSDAALKKHKKRLDHEPAFLPMEYRLRLEDLRRRVHDLVEQDVVDQIEHLFQKLATPQKRQECLNRLSQLFKQDTNG